jgi:hypothetical protein
MANDVIEEITSVDREPRAHSYKATVAGAFRSKPLSRDAVCWFRAQK